MWLIVDLDCFGWLIFVEGVGGLLVEFVELGVMLCDVVVDVVVVVLVVVIVDLGIFNYIKLMLEVFVV